MYKYIYIYIYIYTDIYARSIWIVDQSLVRRLEVMFMLTSSSYYFVSLVFIKNLINYLSRYKKKQILLFVL